MESAKHINGIIRKAGIKDMQAVLEIVRRTIGTVYPHYYALGAVEFFQCHHSDEAVRSDIEEGNVWIIETEQIISGTVTINGNEINRLFVLPEFQGAGLGTALMDFCEDVILKQFDKITLSASFPAWDMYVRRGYMAQEFRNIACEGGDFLPYVMMEKGKT